MEIIPIIVFLYLGTLPSWNDTIDKNISFLSLIVLVAGSLYAIFLVVAISRITATCLEKIPELSEYKEIYQFDGSLYSLMFNIVHVICACIFSIIIAGSLITTGATEQILNLAIFITNIAVVLSIMMFLSSIYYIGERAYYQGKGYGN